VKKGSGWVWVLALTTALGGCYSARSADTAERRPSISMQDGAVVLVGAALNDGRGTVLDAMAGKVPNFRFRRTGQCPQIALRSTVNARSVSSPHVYVDGTRSTDTCILDTISTRNVERVEVYPQGFTKRPGYGRNAHGLILVFLRSLRPADGS
jgi:hypothetical protein